MHLAAKATLLYLALFKDVDLTVEVDRSNVAEQLLAVDAAGHSRAQTRVAVAQLPVHVVQGVGHGVHRVHHELNLPFLFVAGIPADFFQT